MKICVYFTDMAALLQYQQQLAAQQHIDYCVVV
jgi:hypothetical protein